MVSFTLYLSFLKDKQLGYLHFSDGSVWGEKHVSTAFQNKFSYTTPMCGFRGLAKKGPPILDRDTLARC